jgi:hypothetical protein
MGRQGLLDTGLVQNVKTFRGDKILCHVSTVNCVIDRMGWGGGGGGEQPERHIHY